MPLARVAIRSLLAVGLTLLVAPRSTPAQQPTRPRPPIDWDALIDPKLPVAPPPHRVEMVPHEAAPARPTPSPLPLPPGDDPAFQPVAPRAVDLTPRDPAVTAAGLDRSRGSAEEYFRRLGEDAAQTPLGQQVRAAEAATSRKDWAAAGAAIQQARALGAGDSDLIPLLVNLDEAMGRRQHVIATYDEAIRQHPETVVYWLCRGLARCQELDRGGLDDIAEGSRRAGGPTAVVDPTTEMTGVGYQALALAALGDHVAAVLAFDEAMSQPRARAGLRLWLVQSLVAAGQYDRALAELDGPIRPGNEVSIARWRSFALFRAGRFAEALPIYESMPPASDDDARCDLYHALCLVAVGRTAEARTRADALVARFPKNESIQCLSGAVALAERHFDRAFDQFGKLASVPDGRLAFAAFRDPKFLMTSDLDWVATHFSERCRVVPTLPSAFVVRIGANARTSQRPLPEFAVAWVARTRADAGLAPSLCAYAICYHEVQPWRPYAQVGQIAAALLLVDRAKLGTALENVRHDLCDPYTLRDEVREAWRQWRRGR